MVDMNLIENLYIFNYRENDFNMIDTYNCVEEQQLDKVQTKFADFDIFFGGF